MYCRVNTFANKVEVAPEVYHPVHEYQDTLKNIYLDDFKTSAEYKLFQKKTGKTNISFTTFYRGVKVCPCIRQPTMRVCVDEIETVFSEFTSSMKNIYRASSILCDCGFCKSEDTKREDLGEGESE
jgi:hypothetical protein